MRGPRDEPSRRYRLQHKDFLRETVYFNAVLPKGETPRLLRPKGSPPIQYRTCKQPSYDVLARETANVLFLNHCDKSWTADMQRLLGEHFPTTCVGERGFTVEISHATATSGSVGRCM